MSEHERLPYHDPYEEYPPPRRDPDEENALSDEAFDVYWENDFKPAQPEKEQDR